MSLLPGHEDMKPKEIFGFNGDGHALVDYGDDGLKPYKLFVSPGGSVTAKPANPPKEEQGVDQIGGNRERPSLARRLRGVDQAP